MPAAIYAPEELVGRKVAVAAQLKPRKTRGINSQTVAAPDATRHPFLVSFLEDAPIGARLG